MNTILLVSSLVCLVAGVWMGPFVSDTCDIEDTPIRFCGSAIMTAFSMIGIIWGVLHA